VVCVETPGKAWRNQAIPSLWDEVPFGDEKATFPSLPQRGSRLTAKGCASSTRATLERRSTADSTPTGLRLGDGVFHGGGKTGARTWIWQVMLTARGGRRIPVGDGVCAWDFPGKAWRNQAIPSLCDVVPFGDKKATFPAIPQRGSSLIAKGCASLSRATLDIHDTEHPTPTGLRP